MGRQSTTDLEDKPEERSLTRQREEYLIDSEGRFAIDSGEKSNITFQRSFPRLSATLQLNSRLYVASRPQFVSQQRPDLSSFFSLNNEGRCTMLAPLRGRYALSLAGVSSQLIAIGASDGKQGFKSCHSHSISYNKWKTLPSLKYVRTHPASVLLQ